MVDEELLEARIRDPKTSARDLASLTNALARVQEEEQPAGHPTPPDVPTNAGAYAPVTVRAPEGSLVNARPPSAVVAGNVETSQRIADTVLLALAQAADLPAQGQGTMNNLVLGTSAWTYYETIGGGQGHPAAAPGRRACTSGCRTR